MRAQADTKKKIIYLHTIYYPPAPACQGPSGCERYGTYQLILQPFQTFSMSSYNLSKSSKLVSFQLVDFIFTISFKACNLISWNLAVLHPAAICLAGGPPGIEVFTTSWPWALDSGASQPDQKINEIPINLQYSQNHQTGLPRPPEVSKMRSKLVPKIIKFLKKSKKWYLMKTSVFTI